MLGQERAGTSDRFEEHFSILVVNLNPSAWLLGASKTVLLWNKFEDYFYSVAMADEMEAPAIVVFYPEAPWIIMETALAINRKFGRHSSVSGSRRVEEFMGRFGYKKDKPDIRGQAMTFSLRCVLERIKEDVEDAVVNEEAVCRRDILTGEIMAYHQADPAWEIPALLSYRSGASPDGAGADGPLVLEFQEKYGQRFRVPGQLREIIARPE